MTLEVVVDASKCMGSGNCSYWAPKSFELSDEGVAIVTDPVGEPEDKVVLAAKGCPTQAIRVMRDGEELA